MPCIDDRPDFLVLIGVVSKHCVEHLMDDAPPIQILEVELHLPLAADPTTVAPALA
jgi:hypothetical protein